MCTMINVLLNVARAKFVTVYFPSVKQSEMKALTIVKLMFRSVRFNFGP